MKSTVVVAVSTITILIGCDRAVAPVSSEERAAEWSLEPELRIDGHEHSLVPIPDIAVGPDGSVAILQIQTRNVRVFGASGEHRATAGREGRGPGEFTSVERVGWLGDSLWVLDPIQRRVSVFDGVGRLQATLPVPLVSGDTGMIGEAAATGIIRAIAFHPDTSFTFVATRFPLPLLARRFPLSGPMMLGVVNPTSRTPEGAVYVRVGGDGRIRFITAETPITGSYWSRELADGGAAIGEYPFPNRVYLEVGDDGRRTAFALAALEGEEAGTFRVALFGERGDTLYDRRLSFTAVPIAPAAADSAIRTRASSWRGMSPTVASSYARHAYVPPIHPPLAGLVVGADSFLWIQLRDVDGERPYLVLNEIGDVEGRVVLPVNQEIAAADATHLWVIERDELGVQSVIRYRIRRGAGA